MNPSQANVYEYNNKQMLLLPPAVQDLLSKDDIAHVIDEVVDHADLRSFYQRIPEVGHPSYDPRMLIKLWLYGYAGKTTSSRKIAEKLNKDIGFIFLAGMQTPDFRTLSDFRSRHQQELIGLFVQIVQVCRKLGMVQFGEIAIDSKVMKANASKSQSYKRKELLSQQEHLKSLMLNYLKDVEQNDQREDAQYGRARSGKELPVELQDRAKRMAKIQAAMQELDQAEEVIGKHPQEIINLTDPDASLQKNKQGRQAGYRAQVAVDSKEQVILGCDVTAEQNDVHQLEPLAKQALQRSKDPSGETSLADHPAILLADSAYNSGENLAQFSAMPEFDLYTPFRQDHGRRYGRGPGVDFPFHQSKFVHNAQDNTYVCPAGKSLPYRGNSMVKGILKHYYGQSKVCVSCPHFGECTSNRKGRILAISEHQEVMQAMRRKLCGVQGKKIYARRKAIVEAVLGHISQNLGLREFALRTLSKVKAEFALMCSVHNIGKIASRLKRMGQNLSLALHAQLSWNST